MRVLIISLVIALFTGGTARAVGAETIIEQCGTAQTRLTELAIRDGALADQLTANYEHILLNLLLPMNERLVDNQQTVGILTAISDDFAGVLEQWRDDTALYTARMQALRAINCKTAPLQFAANLTETQGARTLLAQQNRRLLDLLTEYQAALPEIWHNR